MGDAVSGTVPVKLEFYDAAGKLLDRRRMRFEDPTWRMIDAEIATRFPSSLGEHRVSYLDHEGDTITLGSEGEWAECVRIWNFDARALRLAVTLTGASPVDAPAHTPAVAPIPGHRHVTPAALAAPSAAPRLGGQGPRCKRRQAAPAAPPSGDGQCKNCAFTTAPGKAFCCKKCCKHPGKHGVNCARVACEAPAVTVASETEPEYVMVTHTDPSVAAPSAPPFDPKRCGAEAGTAGPSPHKYAAQRLQLETMGFFVDGRLLELLVEHDGDVARVVDHYL